MAELGYPTTNTKEYLPDAQALLGIYLQQGRQAMQLDPVKNSDYARLAHLQLGPVRPLYNIRNESDQSNLSKLLEIESELNKKKKRNPYGFLEGLFSNGPYRL